MALAEGTKLGPYRTIYDDLDSALRDFRICAALLASRVGYLIFRSLSVSRITCDTISRASGLWSAGTTYQGAYLVLVALRQSS